MLVYNDYLKDIGVKRTDFPIRSPHSNRLEKGMGVKPCQLWNLNYTLAMELYTYICAFQDTTCCFPAYMESPKEWDKILDEIKAGLVAYIQTRDDPVPNEKAGEQLERSLDLIKEYWGDLWY